MNLEMMVDHLNDETAKSIKALLERNTPTLRERLICPEISERLQCRGSEKYVALTEYPYSNAAASDSLADLRFYEKNDGPCLWVEVKPMLKKFNYWNFSKFFNGKSKSSDTPYTEDSIILNDADKFKKISKIHNDRQQAFAVLLILYRGGKSVEPDPTPPVPKKSLSAGQVIYLMEHRFKNNFGFENTIIQKHRTILDHEIVTFSSVV